MQGPRTVDFYWDVGSPYTYLAMGQVGGLEVRTGARLHFRPFLLGGVFKATDNVAPGANPYKAKYLLADLDRWRRHYRVPMKLPGEVPFPLNTVLPMRVAVAADRAGFGRRFAELLMRSYWEEGRDVSDAGVLASVLAGDGRGPELIAAAQDPSIKEALRANTDEAVRRGAFGAPAFFVDDELYWGDDRLGFLEARLSG